MHSRAKYTKWLVAAALFAGAGSTSSQDSFKIIVNPANPVASISKREISDLFLKRAATWNDGQLAQPVDQVQTSAVRQAFSRDVLGVSADAAARQASAAGDPPPSFATDRDVLAYVRLKAGAIGYVSSATPVVGVKVLALGEGSASFNARAGHGQQPIPVGDVVKSPPKVFDVPPKYPPTARQARKEGSVEIAIVIGTSGAVEETRVIRSSTLFDDAAVAAVRQWKYAPTILNGVAVPISMIVRVDFIL